MCKKMLEKSLQHPWKTRMHQPQQQDQMQKDCFRILQKSKQNQKSKKSSSQERYHYCIQDQAQQIIQGYL